ncbi:hypothetical protein [Pimelobacter simplex]|uniref:hypothetical protein n=1 Tax=Nocardioides simplex TaxID=2045 RepID=UPI00214FF50A|nr:hypothetical protein [Pimelobacter simplex]UUW92556.1 hypothetical protein M0M43_14040 [Pimelobacter simplex]UUW96383.1 hypothetical protein M0M48_02670 [Pimelobacter simplex]
MTLSGLDGLQFQQHVVDDQVGVGAAKVAATIEGGVGDDALRIRERSRPDAREQGRQGCDVRDEALVNQREMVAQSGVGSD